MIVDTNIIIAVLNGEPRATETLSVWKRDGRILLISSITVAETLSLAKLTPLHIQKAQGFLSNFVSVPVDNTVAETAASLRRTYGLSLPDAVIAATAVAHNVPIVTRDRQMKKVKALVTITI